MHNALHHTYDHSRNCQGYAFTPPPGYTLSPTTVIFHVTNLTNTVTADFGYSSTFTSSAGNCHGTGSGGEVTTFVGNSHSTYTLCADIVTGKPGREGTNAMNTATLKKSDVVTEALVKSGSLSIYPNPSSGNVNLEFTLDQADDAGIEVYNSFHEKVYVIKKRVEASENNKLQVDGLPPGVYLVIFTRGSETATQKFIVKP